MIAGSTHEFTWPFYLKRCITLYYYVLGLSITTSADKRAYSRPQTDHYSQAPKIAWVSAATWDPWGYIVMSNRCNVDSKLATRIRWCVKDRILVVLYNPHPLNIGVLGEGQVTCFFFLGGGYRVGGTGWGSMINHFSFISFYRKETWKHGRCRIYSGLVKEVNDMYIHGFADCWMGWLVVN